MKSALGQVFLGRARDAALRIVESAKSTYVVMYQDSRHSLEKHTMPAVTIEKSVVINRPIAEVFDTATCMESCINWWTTVKEATKITPGPTAVGTEYRHISRFMGIAVEARPVITVLDAPRHFAYQSRTPNVALDMDFQFEEVEGGTKMTIKLIAQPSENIVSQTMLPLLTSAAERQFDNDMLALKEMMENGVKVKLW
jgi:uncharacterized protein YndB with AHSA1/START domain